MSRQSVTIIFATEQLGGGLYALMQHYAILMLPKLLMHFAVTYHYQVK